MKVGEVQGVFLFVFLFLSGWTDKQSERDLTTLQKRSHIVAFYVKSSTKYSTTRTHTYTPHFALAFMSMTDRDRAETWRHNLAASFRPTSHTAACGYWPPPARSQSP